jgi:hypothetical protein
VAKWEQRVVLGGVSVVADSVDPVNVIVTVTYTARGQAGSPPQHLSFTLTLGGAG